MLRAMLKPMELSETAWGKAALGTISPTAACQAGPLIAVAHPTRKVKPSKAQGVTHPIQANSASRAETTSMNNWQASITNRRSLLSATAPAQSDSSMIGRVVAAGTSAIIWGEAESEAIIHRREAHTFELQSLMHTSYADTG